ncbi:MAG TPA: GntR family transcriptional regulator [Burkholderiaceae bacterium]|nr:GntR family transcriptional regulator [Burkholderiaceae bacterium]
MPATTLRRRNRAKNGTKNLRDLPAQAANDAATQAVDDRIYASIREAVLDHKLTPGTKLKEVELANLFGVTRNIVRKSLTRLAHEQLVELRINRGAIVANPSIEESRHLFAARRAIEGAIVEALCKNVTKAQVRELKQLVQDEDDAYRRGEVRAGLKLSIEFHRVLARLAGNTVLAQFLEQLVARTPLVLLAYRGPVNQTGCSNEEHAQIVDAIAAGNGARAAALMQAHLQELENQLKFEADEPATDLAAIFGKKRV